jgi:hypothetical protein
LWDTGAQSKPPSFATPSFTCKTPVQGDTLYPVFKPEIFSGDANSVVVGILFGKDRKTPGFYMGSRFNFNRNDLIILLYDKIDFGGIIRLPVVQGIPRGVQRYGNIIFGKSAEESVVYRQLGEDHSLGKARGNSVRVSTLPTGKEYCSRFTAAPRREPAAITGISGVSSQKYLRDVRARSQDWISSKNSRVSAGIMASANSPSKYRTIFPGEISSSKKDAIRLFFSKST